MPQIEDTFTPALVAALAAVEAVPADLAAVKVLDDTALLNAQRVIAAIGKALGPAGSLVAGEVGYRSRRELGYAGLAQREGFRTPEQLVRATTGSTTREATTLVQVGTLVHEAATEPMPGDEITQPWLRAVGAAVNGGVLSLEAARAIRTGLGDPISSGSGSADSDSGGVSVADLTAAAAVLLEEAPRLHVDRLLARARELRDVLDESGIAGREQAIHQQRGFRRVKRPDGSIRLIIDTDLESGALWNDVYDKITSPRRGGPRFVDPADEAWAEAISTDERTTEQYAHDGFTQLLRIAIDADAKNNSRIIGTRLPAVRVLVAADALETHTGHGFIEGVPTPVSIQTVQRIVCTSGILPIKFDRTGQILDLGREERLFSANQKVTLAARDGACMWGDCDCPPSWTEAHHIDEWDRDDGETNVADGVLLCRYHHMLLHNNKWRIVRENSVYWLIPPVTIDPNQTPRQLHSKSRALAELLAHQ